MSSPCRARLVAVAAVAIALAGCDREERVSRAKPIGEIVPASTRPLAAIAAAYEGNANAISQGQSLYGSMNCAGCHSHGGGGMGPALIDDEWRYGGRIDQIAVTINEGRPNGMPAFRGRLSEDQVWQLAAYVRSMSGQVGKDLVSGRAEETANRPPPSQQKREPMRPENAEDQ